MESGSVILVALEETVTRLRSISRHLHAVKRVAAVKERSMVTQAMSLSMADRSKLSTQVGAEIVTDGNAHRNTRTTESGNEVLVVS